ncbi:hypothetical protein SeLEV6574_g01075 [Synchytrium endobioticum]|uniref:RING-type domain-containing protein n=1 Tax=Synchytrium endobioticum TaxID=286115 RepID=A0A507DGZ7_9FUNG|nr:hypothetical protein SeLEV6574_g01075 [Synchytrium endobioticum]
MRDDVQLPPHTTSSSTSSSTSTSASLTHPRFWWSISDMMAFENIAFTKTTDGSAVGLRYLACADCDVGPLGYTYATSPFMLASDRNNIFEVDATGVFIDPDYKCPVCFEWLSEQVTLGCRHSICYGCLQQMMMSAYCKGVCPLCRHRVLNFIRRNAKTPGAMTNQYLAPRIFKKRAELEEPSLVRKRKRADESGNDCDGRSGTKRRAAGGGGVHRYKPSNAAGNDISCNFRFVFYTYALEIPDNCMVR